MPYLLIFAAIFLFLNIQCCTTKSEKTISGKNLGIKNHSPVPLPHSTAEITGTLLKLLENENITEGIFRIDTVHGYGPATPPIGVGSQLVLKFDRSLLENKEKTLSEIFQLDRKYKLTIRSLYESYNRGKSWKIIKMN